MKSLAIGFQLPNFALMKYSVLMTCSAVPARDPWSRSPFVLGQSRLSTRDFAAREGIDVQRL